MNDLQSIDELLTNSPTQRVTYILTPDVKDFFAARGISQTKLAEFLGVSRVTLNQWLNAKVPVPRHWANQFIELMEMIEDREEELGKSKPEKESVVFVGPKNN